MVPGFGIDKRNGPSAAVEAAAAILVRSAQPLHHAVHRDVGRRRQSHVVVTSPNNGCGPLLDLRYFFKTSTLALEYQRGTIASCVLGTTASSAVSRAPRRSSVNGGRS